MRSRYAGIKAFTLVELLVVISIIALLLAVLMPALNSARNSAKVLTCAANSNQIGKLIAIYQAANNYNLPIVINKDAMGYDTTPSYKAQNTYLSVALRSYIGGAQPLPSSVGADRNWNPTQLTNYNKQYLPKFFVCPFVRGKAAGNPRPVAAGTTPLDNVPIYNYEGYAESYFTWAWALAKDHNPNTYVYTPKPSLMRYKNSSPKFGTLRFNIAACTNVNGSTGGPHLDDGSAKVMARQVKWSNADVKYVNSSGLSDATAVFCGLGEVVSWPDKSGCVYNRGSHKKSKFGGSNAVFGDNHVEWVTGSRIGWN